MSQVVLSILVIFFGLCVGSFLNVVISRFDDLKSIVKGRSHCPKCKKEIPWYDLIPLLSYLLLFGKCRACKKTISIQYPLVEAATALVFLIIFLQFGLTVEGFFLAVISSLMIVIAAYDWLHLTIPDILTYLAAFFATGLMVYLLWNNGLIDDFQSWLFYIYGLAIGVGFFGFLVIVSRQKWMGWGDVLLAGFMGILLGFPNMILALFLAFILGSVVSLLLIAMKKKTMKDTVPFGPFLIIATFIALFWGTGITGWYLF